MGDLHIVKGDINNYQGEIFILFKKRLILIRGGGIFILFKGRLILFSEGGLYIVQV